MCQELTETWAITSEWLWASKFVFVDRGLEFFILLDVNTGISDLWCLAKNMCVCRGEGSGNLLVLRNILITFAAFNPGEEQKQAHHHHQMYWSWSDSTIFECFVSKEHSVCDSEVSYAQGMNDLCSRFLEVLDSEVDTFWSFSCYMERFNKDFMADGLHRKIGGRIQISYKP